MTRMLGCEEYFWGYRTTLINCNMMKKIVLSSVLFILFFSLASSQALWKTKRVELTAGLGTTQFFGDIGGFTPEDNILGIKDMSFKQTRFDFSADITYRIIQDANLRLNFAYGMFRANDARGSNIERGFEATTGFFESSLVGEYYFIKNRSEGSFLFTKGRGGNLRSFFETLDFYLFAGIGGLSYNVKGNDILVAHPGFTEGGFTAVIPAGLGINMIFSPELNFGLELGGRYSFSDYLEGYTSQYSKSNDVYYFLNVTATYKMKTNVFGVPLFRR
jgi:hypothetical protein